MGLLFGVGVDGRVCFFPRGLFTFQNQGNRSCVCVGHVSGRRPGRGREAFTHACFVFFYFLERRGGGRSEEKADQSKFFERGGLGSVRGRQTTAAAAAAAAARYTSEQA